jgi:hypothetical protein
VLLLALLCFGSARFAPAQSPAAVRPAVNPSAGAAPGSVQPADAPDLEEIRRQLREQQSEIERLRTTINELRQLVGQNAQQPASASAVAKPGEVMAGGASPASGQSNANTAVPQATADERLGRVEEQTKKNTEAIAKQLGSMTFSGDIRLRYEALYGQLNASANGDNPLILGNEISSRQRFRVRARLNIRGRIGKDFDWGLRLGTGSFSDNISNNQTMTDFFNRKPFSLDNVFIAWTPQRAQGLRIQAGKFDVPWLRTEMTIDNDLNLEGFSETYTRQFKNSPLKNLTLTAWQLPLLERNSAFVRNANGTVNLDESHRAGRDLALYGAQLLARFETSQTVAITLTLADLYFNGTQFISPIQVFGSQLQLPVIINIPATATSPAQTVTAQVSIPRELLVAGNGNLGVSVANNNAINRDGRLASGYNLVDLIGRLDLTQHKRFPVALIFDFVTNTQVHDVSVAGPANSTIFLPNHENNGFWAELQVGKTRERGDIAFGYTYLHIEKDAVLTPFNFSDIAQQSDMRGHRLAFSYAADPRVLLTLTGIVTERPNGLLGAFGTTPPGSLNRPTTRLQFDTTFRF